MKYVGDLSKQDARHLESWCRASHSILEFGCGASTQIFAQALAPSARLISIDTDPNWIERTRQNLKALSVPEESCCFINYEDWQSSCTGLTFDLIFVDGVDEERERFARSAFSYLEINGWIILHDTRRRKDLRNFLEMIMDFHPEVGEVRVNFDDSNLSGFRRKPSLPYENWNIKEQRQPWMTGDCIPPTNWPDML